MNQNYLVKTDKFEGPLDLLLNLIEKKKLHINDISLAKVADDYVEHIRKLESFPMYDVANFIVIASTLVLIKSKSLLPIIDLSSEEEEDIESLKKRLWMYKKMKKASKNISTIFAENIIFLRSEDKIQEVIFSSDSSININNVLLSIKNVLQNLPTLDKIPQAIISKIISLEEVMDKLTERIRDKIQTSFSDLTKTVKDKTELIVSFLAVLELIKKGIIMVNQEKNFDDITIENR
jgi:segregation and condensation protein A